MDAPGIYTLASKAITTALTANEQTAIVDLDGMEAANLIFEFLYGSGGTTAMALVQTSFDGGTTWLDIARADFTTAAAKKYCNLQAIAAKAMTTYAALSSEGLNDGLLGNRLRCVITTTGTYVNTTLAVRASVH
jgi:hypothetical protein